MEQRIKVTFEMQGNVIKITKDVVNADIIQMFLLFAAVQKFNQETIDDILKHLKVHTLDVTRDFKRSQEDE